MGEKGFKYGLHKNYGFDTTRKHFFFFIPKIVKLELSIYLYPYKSLKESVINL